MVKWGKIVDNQQNFNQGMTTGQAPLANNSGMLVTTPPAMNTGANMSPKKSKKIWLIAGGAVLGVAAIGVGAVAFTQSNGGSGFGFGAGIDYGSSYRAAKTVERNLSRISASSNCRDMVDYVQNVTADAARYEEAIKKCNETTMNADEMIGELGSSEGVAKVPDVKAKYDEFRTQLMALAPNKDELTQITDLYATMHQFVLANYESRHLKTSEKSEQTYRDIANILINSGNAGLKAYGEEWLTKKLTWWQKVLGYEGLDTRERRRMTLREEANKMDNELKQWERENLPKSMELPFLDGTSYREMNATFDSLREVITENYEKHYDDSGDCTKILDEVVCY